MGLKVLMFGWEFPPHNSGGLGTACEGLARALAHAGVEIIFVLPKRVGVASPHHKIVFADIDKLSLRTLPGLLYPYITAESYRLERAGLPPGPYGGSLLEEVGLYARRALQLGREEGFDVIHAHDWLSFPAGVAAKAVSGKPLIVHVHATEFDRGGGNSINSEVYRIEREGMRAADRVITVSHWTKDLVVRHYGIAPDKVSVVHNGIETGLGAKLPGGLEVLKRAGNKIVLFVGRITLQKGPDYFVELAKRVLEFEPKVYFVMVGAGDMTNQVIQRAVGYGIADRILFPGFLRGEELDRLYQAADLYILPSVSEPFGITPLESLRNGTPVMISKQSGVAEVISHALKVDFWDVDEMTNQVLAVLRHDSLKHTLAANGGREVQKVTWTEAARKCLDVYAQFAPV